MRYYVVADVHGFYTEMLAALEQKGFFTDTEPHKLIICGDLFDRGQEALQLQQFVMELMERDEVVLIRGNHEDLMLDLLNGWHRKSYLMSHHVSNGTLDTVCQLTESSVGELFRSSDEVGRKLLNSPLVQKIIPAMVDYFETDHYIFVHGWIPCTALGWSAHEKEYVFIKNWRTATEKQWSNARWENGMEAANKGIVEPDKTIVCGHWHSSYGHAHYEGKGGEFENADFSPYYGNGIIAIDGCTSYSGIVNCIVIED